MDPSVQCHQQPVRSYSSFTHQYSVIYRLFPVHRNEAHETVYNYPGITGSTKCDG